MTTGSTHLEYRRLRAPDEDGAVVVEPPFMDVAELLRANRSRRSQWCYDLQGRSLSEVASEARRAMVAEAQRWTSQYLDLDSAPFAPSTPILMAGHQPQLFHPGVWLKNFALGTLARKHGALAINLVIDSDTVKSTNVRVPGGSVASPLVEEIPLDQTGPVVPYEERRVVDRRLFCDFGRRAADRIASLVPEPLVRDYWPMAVARMDDTDSLGACLAQSRHQLETRWAGLRTLEIPQSRICRMPPHDWFVAHLLGHLPRFQAAYNQVVEEYRRVNRIRSAAHPVPNLTRCGEWLEAPFWIWTADDPRRRRLFARRRGDQIVLSDRQTREIALPLAPDGDGAHAVERLAELSCQGVKIRCRALITTLWARLVLGDLFLHGIGGAKYDQVTDALIARFFGLQPPGFLVLSATLHLPIPRRRTTGEDVRAMKRRLRELTYHPECSINEPADVSDGRWEEAAKLIALKRQWIETPQTPQNARTRYREFRRINRALGPFVARKRERVLEEHDQAARARKAEAILAWRGYAFCLHPDRTLREFFDGVLHKTE